MAQSCGFERFKKTRFLTQKTHPLTPKNTFSYIIENTFAFKKTRFLTLKTHIY